MPRNFQDLQGQLGGDEVERRMRMLPLAARLDRSRSDVLRMAPHHVWS